MSEIILIRHARTQGNLEKRYIGQKTDEDILPSEYKSINELGYRLQLMMPDVSSVSYYVSPMLRCRQTLQGLFGDVKPISVDDLKEIDFGDFENHNYLELSDNPHYQAWLDSGGTIPFRNGEALEDFIVRSSGAFRTIAGQTGNTKVIVCHGGNIMAIMSRITNRDYYDFQVDNLDGFYINLDENDSNDISYSSLNDWLRAGLDNRRSS